MNWAEKSKPTRDEFSQKDDSKLLIITIVAAGVALLCVAMLFIHLLSPGAPSTPQPISGNRLLLGSEAPEAIDIPAISIGSSQVLLGKAELFSVRHKAIDEAKSLLVDEYTPSTEVFGRIDENQPWLTNRGLYVEYNEEQNENKGTPVEARAIINPFILVVPEFWGLSVWAERNLAWDMKKVQDISPSDQDFPYCPSPQRVSWEPKKRRASVFYNVSKYINAVNKYTIKPLLASQIDFGINAYNARDFNFKFIKLALDKSVNISNPKDSKIPIQIVDYVGSVQGLCSAQVFCNHRSDPMPEFDTIKVTALPARAVFQLWEELPTAEARLPTMEFTIVVK